MSAPHTLLDNACSIVDQRPKYWKAMKRTERKYGVPVAVQMPTIYQEGKVIGNARTPHQFALGIIPMGRQSSAYGYSQALDGTWEECQRSTRNRRAKRDDIDDATDFMGWYMAQTNRDLGIPLTRQLPRQGLADADRRIAGEIGQRSVNYHAQLISCGKA